MSCDHRIIPDDLKAEVTKNVSQALKMRLNLKLEKLEKSLQTYEDIHPPLPISGLNLARCKARANEVKLW